MIGIDEVGRGALAGPLVVAGCYFFEDPATLIGLDDSKKLTRTIREKLDSGIRSIAKVDIVEISPSDIDKKGLTLALREAILSILHNMPEDEVIQLDGKYNFLKNTDYEARTQVQPGADGLYQPVMAASIIAKVYRDSVMKRSHEVYRMYGFDTHVGYGTKKHLDALRQFGPCPIHRRSVKPVRAVLELHS